MTDLQVAKQTVDKLADALWNAQGWETVEQCRGRVMRGLNEAQEAAVEKLIMAGREKRAVAAEDQDDSDDLVIPE